jgi:salicylate hydroxylase
MKPKDDCILIAGGGLGGLATALALGRKGWPVRVLEETPQFGALGYGIQLGPNAFSMFERLGIADAVLSKSDFPTCILMLDAYSGKAVARIPTGALFRKRFTHPYVVIHRIDLHQVLLDACRSIPNVELDPSTTVAGFEDQGDRVLARAHDGRTFTGAAIIGADGMRSAIRAQLFHDGDPRLVGYVAHRTIVPMNIVPADVPRNEVVLWAGAGFHIVHYPLRHGSLFNIVAVFRTPTHAEKGDVEHYRFELEKTYAQAHRSMKALLARMDLHRRWPIADRDPIRCWSKGRVTLLGDAAHPTLQSLAQGACMAIEDSVCLAEFVDRAGGNFVEAFRQYQRLRNARTARVQFESRALWDIYHASGTAREARRQSFAKSAQDMFECLAWLYDGFSLRDKTSNRLSPHRGRTANEHERVV